ncbi:MAG: hypothetical protein AUI36_27975 [Cyanobacteria bacterium 13_1_40CM_2_61_4]|nr:MAG: hypothetical protein AUI36_27975 [Cyanobacteria bacterium 13_1_40CM_2_61_4]
MESFNFLSRIFKTRNLIAENAVIVDVGANIGFTSIWFSKMVADKNGSVYSFEPAPPVLEILRRNLALNDILNVQVVEAVCSDRVGVADFFIGFHHHTSSLFQAWAGGQSGNSRQIEVAATSLDDFFLGRESRTPPDFIKMDIEGGGVYALKGCSKCIEAKRPMIWIESHTPEEDGAISDVLLRHQYRAFRLQTHSLVKNIRSTHPDVDGVWGTMLLFPTEDTEHIASLVAAH